GRSGEKEEGRKEVRQEICEEVGKEVRQKSSAKESREEKERTEEESGRAEACSGACASPGPRACPRTELGDARGRTVLEPRRFAGGRREQLAASPSAFKGEPQRQRCGSFVCPVPLRAFDSSGAPCRRAPLGAAMRVWA